MPRDITVTFSDGSSHVYRNAPDNLTPAQAEARARKDYPNLQVARMDGGRGGANTIDTITGALATFNRNALPFMDEAADGLQAVSNMVQGRAGSLPEAWKQARKA
ncbi:MAG: hypothetical protein IM651_11035, partial [Phenylobacterium sp.]|nr:hypothetical protein [Phenylobacterium sp.]